MIRKFMSEPAPIFKGVVLGYITVRIVVSFVGGDLEIRVHCAGSSEVIEYYPTKGNLNSVLYGMVVAYSALDIRVYIEDSTDLVKSVDGWRTI